MTNTFFSVDFCSLVMIMIILSNIKKIKHFAKSSFYFEWILRVLATILMVDIVAWSLIGNSAAGACSISWLVNSLYFVLSAVFPYLWLRYAYCILHDDKDMTVEVGALASLPMIFLIVISAMTPFTHHLFYLDENGMYHRGIFFAIQYLIIFAYIMLATVWALVKMREQCTKEKKEEYLQLARFAVLPFVGSVIQIVGADMVLAWPCTALSALMIYIKFNNHEISIDALTGLNNRGTFNRYLRERCESVDELRADEGVFLTLIDVNDFKKINDQFGHNIGDVALKKTAEVLKNVFGNTKAFISRYGGDEFAVVSVSKNAEEIEEYLIKLNEQLEALYIINSIPCKVQLSYGTARYGTYQTYSIEQLTEVADKKMYEKKVNMKREQAEKNG